MKSGIILGLGLNVGLGLSLAMLALPYATAFIPGPAGNPNQDSYVGEPGGVYDIAANPPKTIGVVAYNPYAPLPAGPNSFGANGTASGTLPPMSNTPATPAR